MTDKDKKDISKMSRKEFLEYHKDLERGGPKARQQARDDIIRIHKNTQDEKLVDETKKILQELDISLDELAREMKILDDKSAAGRPEDIQKFMDAIKAGNAAKARRYSKSKDVKGAAKRARSRRGWCPLLLLVVLLITSGIVWATYEGVAALASVLF